MKNLIGNSWRSSSSNEVIEVQNPYSHVVLDTVPNSNFDDINEAVQISDESRKDWYGISINERCEIILKFKDLVKEERYDLVKLIKTTIPFK